MLGLMDGIKMVLGAAVAAALVFYPAKRLGIAEGRKAVYAELARAAVKYERERNADDAETQNLDDYSVCLRDIGARGLPVEACAELRGLPAE